MKWFSFIIVLVLVPFLAYAQSTNDSDFVNKQLNMAVFELYAQNSEGILTPYCTATAFDKVADGSYLFLTAGHCVVKLTDEGDQGNSEEMFFLRVKHSNGFWMKRATIFAVGCVACGDDFAVLLVDTPDILPVVKLGDDPSRLGEEIWNMAAPSGIGLQFFKGYVTRVRLDDRRILRGRIGWKEDYMLLDIAPTASGSSGSAIVCKEQRAICGLLVGFTNERKSAVAAPVSRFERWLAGVLKDKNKK